MQAEHHDLVAPQYDNLEHQHETAVFGMWVFLMTEVMLFGALFAAYAVYRFVYSDAFFDASQHLDVTFGGINTVVLITSSFTMALAVRSAQVGARRSLVGFLLLTMLLGLTFMGIKAAEYYHDYQIHIVPGLSFVYPGEHAAQAQLFFLLYFLMTGVHAIHLTIAIGVVGVLIVLAWRGRYSAEYYNPIENAGLYWHFVDIIWVFLLPLLYLPGWI